MSITEFASEAGISERTVYRLIQDGTVESRQSEVDRRRRLIPRAELDRLFAARQDAMNRAAVAGGAAGFLDAHWRIGYRKAVRELADAGAGFARHLREMDLKQPDDGAEHEPDHCEHCRDTLDQLLKASERARGYAYLAPIAAELYHVVREAGRVADEAQTALKEGEPNAS